MRAKAAIFVVLAASVYIGEARAARPKWGRGDRKKRWERIKRDVDKRLESSRKTSSSNVDMVAGGKGEEALKWHTDFAEAAELAKREKRPLMLLFATEELTRKSRSCTFAANRVRRAVRSCKAVPLRLFPPVQLSSEGVPEEEASKRQEFYEKEMKRYRALTKKYRIANGPALVFTGADTTELLRHLAPNDDVIESSCSRLGEMIRARQKKLEKKKAVAGGDPAKGPIPAKQADGKKKEAQKKETEQEQQPVGDPEEDF